MKRVGVNKNTRWLTFNPSNNVIHIPEEQFYLLSILLAVAPFSYQTVISYQISVFDAYTSSQGTSLPQLRWYQFRHLSHSISFVYMLISCCIMGTKLFISSAGCISAPAVSFCFKANFIHRFARITTREVSIAIPST